MSSAAGSSRESAANSTISDAVYRHNAAQVSRLQDRIASLMALPQELDLELDFEEVTEVEDVREERRATVYGRHLNEQQAEALKPLLEQAELEALQSNVREALRREDAPYEDYFSDIDTDDGSSSEPILSEPSNVLLPEDRDLELDTARTAIQKAQEIGKKFEIDESLVHLRYHGVDAPKHFPLGEKRGTFIPRHSRKAIIRFSGLKEYSFGTLERNSEVKSPVAVRFNTSSNFPTILVDIQWSIEVDGAPVHKKATAHIFGTDLDVQRSNPEVPVLRFECSRQGRYMRSHNDGRSELAMKIKNNERWIQYDNNVERWWSLDKLMLITMRLRRLAKDTNKRVVITGDVTATDLETMGDIVEAGVRAGIHNESPEYIQMTKLAPHARLLGHLHSGIVIDTEILFAFSSEVPTWRQCQEYSNFGLYMEAALTLTSELKNMWWYRCQFPEQDPMQAGYPYEELQVARWQTYLWEGRLQSPHSLPAGAEWSEADVDDRAPPAPYAWHSMALPEAWPDMEDQIYAANLAMHRVSQYGAEVSYFILEHPEEMRGIFTARPNDNDQYYVRVFSGIDRASYDCGTPKPGTKLTLVLVDCQYLRLRAQVIEEVGETKADLSLIVHTKGHDFNLSGQEFAIRLNFGESADLHDHHVDAISRTIWRQKRTKGFFLQHVIFACAIPADHVPCQISNPPSTAEVEYSNTLKHTVEQLGLDTAQTAAAMMTWHSPVSATIIYGPSGTGTTTTIMSAVLGHVLAGAKVLVTSPTDGGVTALLKSWMKILNSWKAVSGRKNNINWTLYKGCYLSSKPVIDPNATGDPDKELSDGEKARMEMWTEIASQLGAGINTGHEQYGFARRRMDFAKQLLRLPETSLSAATRYYVDNASNISKRSKQQKMLFLEHEEVLSVGLVQMLDVVFCTCSISADDVLSTVFEPTIIVIDEAGCATTPDSAVPLTTFVESAGLVILGGSRKQQPPMVLSENNNEAFRMVQTSIIARHNQFSRKALRLDQHIPVMKLDTQYRIEEDNIE